MRKIKYVDTDCITKEGGQAVAQLVEGLRLKTRGCGFDPR